MKLNEGAPDRLIRAMLALVLLALGIGGVLSGVVATISIVIGAILGLTALIGFCPMYALLKTNTLE